MIRFLQIPDNFVQAYLIQVLHHRQPQLFLEKLGQIVGIVAECAAISSITIFSLW